MIGSKHTLCLYICVWFNCVMIYMLSWRITIVILSGYLLYQKSWQWWPIHFKIFQFCFNIFVCIPQSFYVYILMKRAKSTIGICSFLLQSQFCGVHDQLGPCHPKYFSTIVQTFLVFCFSDNLDCLQENSYFAGFWLRYDM